VALRRQAAQLAIRRLVRLASAGLGHKFIDSETTKFAGALGVGSRRLRAERPIKDPASGEVIGRIKGDAPGGAVATGSVNIEHKLTATTKLLDRLLVGTGASNTLVGTISRFRSE
jgi:putative salt-induced outer membrane protein YdiY